MIPDHTDVGDGPMPKTSPVQIAREDIGETSQHQISPGNDWSIEDDVTAVARVRGDPEASNCHNHPYGDVQCAATDSLR